MKYKYYEFEMDLTKSLIEQLNEKGKQGLHFICMAQRIDHKTMDFRSGQPKVTMTLIFESTLQLPEVQSEKLG